MELAGGFGGQSTATSGTSIFDPVLCELLYRWFSPAAGSIFDPFAGGSVRGIVASKLGRLYCGIELRPEQIAANEQQAETICKGDAQPPIWIEGDSTNAKELTAGGSFDFMMACPPYADLEQYSEDPRDLSNMPYEKFCEAYAAIIAAGLELLKPDRFACYVIGDVRCPDGFYRGLPEFTVKAFEQAGARKYNEAILVTAVGSLPIRIGKQFNAGRKLGKTHQNVLIFCKGDPKRAAEACNGQLELKV
jgi:DNA modification methylase